MGMRMSVGRQDSQATVDALSSSHDKNHPLVETGVSTHRESRGGKSQKKWWMTSGLQKGKQKHHVCIVGFRNLVT